MMCALVRKVAIIVHLRNCTMLMLCFNFCFFIRYAEACRKEYRRSALLQTLKRMIVQRKKIKVYNERVEKEILMYL